MDSSENRVEFDSAMLAVVAAAQRNFTGTTTSAGGLNLTQYRVLLKAHELDCTARIGDLAAALGERPNTVTIIAGQLHRLQLVERTKCSDDRRATRLVVTDEGRERIRATDAALIASLTSVWAPRSAGLLTALLAACRAARGGVLSQGGGSAERHRFAADCLTSIVRTHHEVAETVAEASGLSLTQYRALLRASEVPMPARITDVAVELELRPCTVTFAVDALEAAGLVARAEDPTDGRATVLLATSGGRAVVTRVQEALRVLSATRWGSVLQEQRGSEKYVRHHIVIETLKDRRSAHAM